MTAKQAENQRRLNRVVVNNRKAFHDYHIIETLEAGIVLTGTEIKSVREGKISISEAYARIRDGELWLMGAHISPYAFGTYANPDPLRPRKLLAHKAEIRELRAMVEQKGMTLVPLRVAIREGRAKVDIGVGRGKKLYDKRATSAARDAQREVDRSLVDR
jgi:SsrA-binding protein